MNATIEIQKRAIKASSNHLYSQIKNEAVILELSTGVYYGLNETGARIWQWIQEPKQFQELHQLIMQEYDVESQQCERDLQIILEDMVQAGIIELL